MAGMTVDKDECVGCGLCASTCPQNAISLAGGKAAIGEECVACGLCLDACRLGAIRRESGQRQQGLEQYRGILVFAEQHQGHLEDVTLELLCKAKELQRDLDCKICAVVPGRQGSRLAQTLIDHGADMVYVCPAEELDEPLEQQAADLVEQAIRRFQPEIVLFGATELGRSLAPRVAARLHTGLTADCTVLEIDREKRLLQQTRPAFGGNLMATIVCPDHRPQMATVRPGVFVKGEPETRQGEVEALPAPACQPAIQLVANQIAQRSAGIADAPVIVAVGKGIGSQKNIQYAQQLADRLGGQVGASRPLVDAGWAQYSMQVGQTGHTVAPKLYIACGISGAIQHLAGMAGAQTVVAINTDPDAPIFRVAHYAVVGDCVEVLKQLLAQLPEAPAPGGNI